MPLNLGHREPNGAQVMCVSRQDALVQTVLLVVCVVFSLGASLSAPYNL